MGSRKTRKRGCTVSTGASFFFGIHQGDQMKNLPIKSTTILFGIITTALFVSVNYAWV